MTLKDSYNSSYKNFDYFKYGNLLYYAYIKKLIMFIGLEKGSKVLDVGCGQGFFSNLFKKCDMEVTGVDLSDVGIQAAKDKYGHSGIKFIATDIMTLDANEKYDFVFSRNFSMYNTPNIVNVTNVTDKLVSFLNNGGVYLFITRA